MYFSWYSADFCSDPDFAALQDGELKANPSIASWPEGRTYLTQQQARLPRHKYRRLHLNLPGLPEGAAFSADHVVDAIVPDRKPLEPVSGVEYFAGVDMSGGSSDDAVLAIAHRDEDGKAVLDVIEAQTGVVRLHRTPVEEGALFNGERPVVNIANHMSLRFQNDVAALNRALDRPVHNHSLGLNRSRNMSLARDSE
jgi:hypothetical protein